MTPPSRSPVLRFGPDRRLTAVLIAVGAIVGAFAAVTSDAGGRLLWGAAALVLIAYGVGDLIFWPRLRADADGLLIRTPMVRADLSWAQVDEVRADVRSRHGLRSTTLEVDAGELLVVFSRRALGTDPEHAADLVRALARR